MLVKYGICLGTISFSFIMLIPSLLAVPVGPLIYSFDPTIFQHYTDQWNTYHSQWISAHEYLPRCDPSESQMVFSVCVNDSLIVDPQSFKSDSAVEGCPVFSCVPTINGCGIMPSDTIDYLSPTIATSLDNVTISRYEGESPWLSSFTLGLDQAIPPDYLPLAPIKLVIGGKVTGRTPTACLPLDNAEVLAWQIDPVKLDTVSFQHYFTNIEQLEPMNLSSLRNVSSAARQHTDPEGGYMFNTLLPPSYGPPRHIMLKVSAPGYQALVTRVYFDKDWRLQQLTTLGGEEQSRGLYSSSIQFGFSTDRNESDRKFPGMIASDPRVAKLKFIEEGRRAGLVKGHFQVTFDITLSPTRPADPYDKSNTIPIDLNGVWSDPMSGKVQIETHGSFFYAKEIPHSRKWGAISGYLVGNTIRGVSFLPALGYQHPIQDSQDNGRLSTSLLASTSSYSTGVIVPSDPFSSSSFSPQLPNEISILWSGGQYEGVWSKLDASFALGYRFLKLTVSRVTGDTAGGTMNINEIQFFAGYLGHIEYPTLYNKMTTPRYPIPQVVTCSSYIDQYHHCYKAFDGSSNSSSVWTTKAVGERRLILAQPQWILLDLGNGRDALPTAVRIVCSEGCPRTFTVYGSNDNVKFDTLYIHDYKEYNHEYDSSEGVMFYFGIDSVQGRLIGQGCGSCEIGPKFSCHLSSYDGSCNTHYCGENGLCSAPPICAAGKYLSLQYRTFAMPSFICSLCPAGRYGDKEGLKSAYCSGLCEAGYYCPAGSSSSKQLACGGRGVYCPEGSPLPLKAPAGRKTATNTTSVSESGDGQYQTHTEPCSPGHYCMNGIELPCPVGVYGNTDSLSTPLCSAQCRAGTYCPEGSVFPTICPLSAYCPDGQVTIPCPAGRYGSTEGLKDVQCSGACSPGYYCPERSNSSKSVACPAGRYGQDYGLKNSNCSGLCEPGYYCPVASNSSRQRECGGSLYYCPKGSAAPMLVMKGYYTAGGDSKSTRYLQIEAPLGFFALEGEKFPCPAGTYGSAMGLSGDDVLIPFYTNPPTSSPSFRPTASPSLSLRPTIRPSPRPTADSSKIPTVTPSFIPSGRPTRVPSSSPSKIPSLAPSGIPSLAPSRSPTAVPTLTAIPTVIPTAGPTLRPSAANPTKVPTRTPSSKPSIRPTFAPSSKPTTLLDFTLSPTSSPTVPDQFIRKHFICSGLCAPGYYCPANSTAPTQVPCPAGRYGAIAGLTMEHCTDHCPLGHYCPAGSVSPLLCPAGRYGNVTGLKDQYCSEKCVEGVGCDPMMNFCEEGYFCPPGSISSKQYTCESADKYCPRGSATPLPVQQGYYSIGGNEFTRVNQLMCEEGNFCVKGKKNPCPAGRYGETRGLFNPNCSGPCLPGHYCPAGTVNAYTFRCPAGRYGATYGLENSACTGICTAGYHCPEASTSPTQLQCAIVGQQEVSNLSHWNDLQDSVYVPAPPSASLTHVYLDAFDIIATKSSIVGLFDLTISAPNKVYCPNASSLPLLALPGYYTIGVNRTTRSEQVLCPKGSYCVDGVKYACPAGRYGDQTGQFTDMCSGLCAKGYYCLEGSTLFRQYPCPAGRYGGQEGLTSALCSGGCSKPLLCPVGSTSKA